MNMDRFIGNSRKYIMPLTVMPIE